MMNIGKSLVAATLALGLATPALAQTTSYNPMPGGGGTLYTPGAEHPNTYINRMPGGGATFYTPGVGFPPSSGLK